MGAVVAFELARTLAAAQSAACRRRCSYRVRARRDSAGDGRRRPIRPTKNCCAEGVFREALEDPELLRMVLPALRADTALYRNYVYQERPPLGCPIHAYGGAADPNVTPEHLEAWQEHTEAAASVRIFPGGHFFLQTAPADLPG